MAGPNGLEPSSSRVTSECITYLPRPRTVPDALEYNQEVLKMSPYIPIALFLAAFILHLVVAFGAKTPKVDLSSLAQALLALALLFCLAKLP